MKKKDLNFGVGELLRTHEGGAKGTVACSLSAEGRAVINLQRAN